MHTCYSASNSPEVEVLSAHAKAERRAAATVALATTLALSDAKWTLQERNE